MTNAVNLASAGGTGFSFRNRIINGDMRIDQRNAGASLTPSSGSYTLDRWVTYLSQASKITVQQNAGAVTPPTGFKNYLGITSSSAYTVGSAEEFEVCQSIEGFNAADFAWGTAQASAITLSFWVRSSLTGTFGGFLKNSAGTRLYVFSYTISSANTWEQKTVTIAGDTSGTWATDNTIGVMLGFSLGAGSTRVTTAGSWSATAYVGVTGQQNLVSTSGATLYITGVQLEVGSVATPFERRPYGVELALCQRYFEKSYSYSIVPGTANPNADGNTDNYDDMEWAYVGASSAIMLVGNTPVRFKVTKRSKPTLVVYSPVTGSSGTVRNFSNATEATTTGSNYYSVLGTTSVGAQVYLVYGTAVANVNFGFHWTATAEI